MIDGDGDDLEIFVTISIRGWNRAAGGTVKGSLRYRTYSDNEFVLCLNFVSYQERIFRCFGSVTRASYLRPTIPSHLLPAEQIIISFLYPHIIILLIIYQSLLSLQTTLQY